MLRMSAGLATTAALLMLAGCGKKEATPTINTSMTQVMEPSAQAIWEVASNAYNDRGDALLAAKISDANWKTIADESARMKERAELLATAEHIVVAAANEPILGSQAAGEKGQVGPAWDAQAASQVQARIDADPALFAKKARVLVDAADALHRAALTKDVVLLYKVSSELDEVCDGCHEPFWGTDEPPPFPKSAMTTPTVRGGDKAEHARLEMETALMARVG